MLTESEQQLTDSLLKNWHPASDRTFLISAEGVECTWVSEDPFWLERVEDPHNYPHPAYQLAKSRGQVTLDSLVQAYRDVRAYQQTKSTLIDQLITQTQEAIDEALAGYIGDPVTPETQKRLTELEDEVRHTHEQELADEQQPTTETPRKRQKSPLKSTMVRSDGSVPDTYARQTAAENLKNRTKGP